MDLDVNLQIVWPTVSEKIAKLNNEEILVIKEISNMWSMRRFCWRVVYMLYLHVYDLRNIACYDDILALPVFK